MKQALMVALSLVCVAVTAEAQTPDARPAPTTHPAGFAQGIGGVNFWSAATGLYGVGGGINLTDAIQITVEIGGIHNLPPSTLQAKADHLVNDFLAPLGRGTVTDDVKAKVFYVTGGARYLFAPMSMWGREFHPYALGEIGVAHLTPTVRFVVNGADVTATLSDFGVALGADLTGSQNKFLVRLGGGVTVPVVGAWAVDAGVRYGRIFTDDKGTNLAQLFVGFGYQF